MTTNAGRAPSGQAGHEPSQSSLSRPSGDHPSRDGFKNDLQRGYAAWGAGDPFDKFQTAEWADGWKTADDFAWWKEFASRLGGSVHGFSHRYAATIIIEGEYHNIEGALVRAIAAIAMEAAKPSRRETDSTEGDNAGPQDIAQRTNP